MNQLEPSSPKVHPAVSQTATLTVPLLFNVHSFKHLIYAQDFWNLYTVVKRARLDDVGFRTLPPRKSNDPKVRHNTTEASHLKKQPFITSLLVVFWFLSVIDMLATSHGSWMELQQLFQKEMCLYCFFSQSRGDCYLHVSHLALVLFFLWLLCRCHGSRSYHWKVSQ